MQTLPGHLPKCVGGGVVVNIPKLFGSLRELGQVHRGIKKGTVLPDDGFPSLNIEILSVCRLIFFVIKTREKAYKPMFLFNET